MALDIIRCSFCGRAFVDIGGHRPVCVNCRDEEEILYRKARDLIRDNPDREFGVADIAKIFDVDECKINSFIDCGLFHLAPKRNQEEFAVVAEFLKEERSPGI
ncbi:MAG: hypothetical protein LBI74_08780 [Synergistaceae bacterium]|nr:hypothetical protein [Synergistaceae bacterium]